MHSDVVITKIFSNIDKWCGVAEFLQGWLYQEYLAGRLSGREFCFWVIL